MLPYLKKKRVDFWGVSFGILFVKRAFCQLFSNWVRNSELSLSQKVFITWGIQFTQTHTQQSCFLLFSFNCQLKRWSSALQCTYWNLPLSHPATLTRDQGQATLTVTQPPGGQTLAWKKARRRDYPILGRSGGGYGGIDQEGPPMERPLSHEMAWYTCLLSMADSLTLNGINPHRTSLLGWQLLSPWSPLPRPSSAQRQSSNRRAALVKQFLVVCQDVHCLCQERWGGSLAVKSCILWLLRRITGF